MATRLEKLNKLISERHFVTKTQRLTKGSVISKLFVQLLSGTPQGFFYVTDRDGCLRVYPVASGFNYSVAIIKTLNILNIKYTIKEDKVSIAETVIIIKKKYLV